MKIVIIGAGKVGAFVAGELSGEAHDIVLVDPDRTTLERLCEELDVMGVCGNGVVAEDQLSAGVAKSDVVLAATRNDETNLVCCLIAKALGAAHTVARVRDPEYSAQSAFMRDKLGIDLLVNPEYEAAEETIRLLRYGGAAHAESFGHGGAELVAVRIPAGSAAADRPLREFPKAFGERVLVCAIERGDDVIIPGGDTELKAGDLAYLTGSPVSLTSLFRKMGIEVAPARSVLIVGGGRISHYLADGLTSDGIKVKIVERDRAECERLAEALPKATVVCGDGTDGRFLSEEGLERTDGLVTLTGNDEVNMMLSLYAHTCGVERIITKVSGGQFSSMFGRFAPGAVVSPKAVTGAQMVRFTRSVAAGGRPGGMGAFYRIAGGKAEASEFTVDDPALTGKRLRDLRLRPGIIVAGLLRDKEFILPDGSTELRAGDSAIVISARYKFARLGDILLHSGDRA